MKAQLARTTSALRKNKYSCADTGKKKFVGRRLFEIAISRAINWAEFSKIFEYWANFRCGKWPKIDKYLIQPSCRAHFDTLQVNDKMVYNFGSLINEIQLVRCYTVRPNRIFLL